MFDLSVSVHRCKGLSLADVSKCFLYKTHLGVREHLYEGYSCIKTVFSFNGVSEKHAVIIEHA